MQRRAVCRWTLIPLIGGVVMVGCGPICGGPLGSNGGACSTEGGRGGAGQDAGVPQSGGSPPGFDAGPPLCRPPRAVTTADEIIAQLGTEWPFGNLGVSAGLKVTDDLSVTVNLTLDAQTIPMPTNCSNCGSEVWFNGDGFPGATLVPPDSGPSYLIRYLRIEAGTAIRLRPVLQDNHPMSPPRVAVVRLLSPCTVPCEADQKRCASDAVCYGVGKPFCLQCEGRRPAVCACESPTGTRADGTWCEYAISGDQFESGVCLGGTCQTTQPAAAVAAGASK